MRAIDADVLFREMEKAQWYNNADRDEIAEELVLNAPTIEPQRTGRWQEDPSGYGFWICSACGFVSEASGADLLYNFCPHCGADMRGEQDE